MSLCWLVKVLTLKENLPPGQLLGHAAWSLSQTSCIDTILLLTLAWLPKQTPKNPSCNQSATLARCYHVSKSLWLGGRNAVLHFICTPMGGASCLPTGLRKTQTFSCIHYCSEHFSQDLLHSKDDNYKLFQNILRIKQACVKKSCISQTLLLQEAPN